MDDSLKLLSEELFCYNKGNLISKAFLLSLNSDTAVREFKYNIGNKLSSISYYYLNKNRKEHEYSIEFTYDEKGYLILEEKKGSCEKDSYVFKHDSDGRLIEQKIYQTNDIKKIVFEYDNLGRVIRKDELEDYTIYYYWQGLKVKEEVYNNYNEFKYDVLYKYENGLVTQIDYGASVLKFSYINEKLHKRKEISNIEHIHWNCGTEPATNYNSNSLRVYEYYEQ